MQGKRLLIAAVQGCLTLVFASPALATMSVPYGWYIEANVGSSHISGVNYPGSSSSSGIGVNGNLGYKFMPYFGLELGYTQYHNITIKQNSNKAGTVKQYSYDLAGRAIFPIVDSGAELFAKVGVQRLNARVTIDNATTANNIGLSRSSHTVTGLYLGLGGQYYIWPAFAVNVQWQRADGNSRTGNADLFSIGLSFIFD